MIKLLFYTPFLIPIVIYIVGIYLIIKFKETLEKIISGIIFINAGNISFWILFGIYKLLKLNLVLSNIFIIFMIVITCIFILLFTVLSNYLRKMDYYS